MDNSELLFYEKDKDGMTILNNLSNLESLFDIFIFDAYGVFYDGSKFYPRAKEYLEHLVACGKIVIVLSNSSQTAEKAAEGYLRRGLEPHKAYNFFVTSGQVCHEDALNGKLPVSGNKFFVIGKNADTVTHNQFYRQVDNLSEADFVYISVPYLDHAEVTALPDMKAEFLPSKTDSSGNIILWDSKVITPFLPLIEMCVRQGLPAVNANPDFYAPEKHIGMRTVEYVVRNGLIAEYYRKAGGKVIEYGKPHPNVYDYVFRLLQQHNITYHKNGIAMIGDTIRTDIKGAENSGISPILCVETGITAEEIRKGKRLEDLLAEENIDRKNIYLIRSIA